MNYLVDECFRAEVEKHNWCAGQSGYVMATGGPLRNQRLHRHVWRLSGRPMPESPLTIDHINRDPADNRLENLRVATARLQKLNRRGWRAARANHSLPRGVNQNPRSSARPYFSQIVDEAGVRQYLGSFATPEEASAAYEAELARQIEIEETRVKELLACPTKN
jgi:hypothetical protein